MPSVIDFIRDGFGARRAAILALGSNPFFDPAHFAVAAGTTPDEAARRFAAAQAPDGFDPHPMVDLVWLAAQFPAGTPPAQMVNALAGETPRPDLTPHPLFDPQVYLSNLPAEHGEAAVKLGPALHFLRHWHETRADFSPWFDIGFYLRFQPRLPAGMNPLEHYCRTPPDTRRDCNPLFHSGYYRMTYDCAGEPLSDFLTAGHRRGRLPNPYAAQELPDTGSDSLLGYIRVAS